MKRYNYLLQVFAAAAMMLGTIATANGSAVRPQAITRGHSGQILGGSVFITGPGSGGPIYLGSTFGDSSADGNVIVFTSTNLASDYIPEVTDSAFEGTANVFIRDLRTNATQCLSCRVDSGVFRAWGGSNPRITPDGRYVVFSAVTPSPVPLPWTQVFRYDTVTGIWHTASVANNGLEGGAASITPVISDNGRYVAFISYASNLVDGYSGSGAQVYVRDLEAGQTFLASHTFTANNVAGNTPIDVTQPLSISSNGRFTVWTSASSNYSAFTSDNNGQRDVFYFDVFSSANNVGVASINNVGVATGNGESTTGIIAADSGSFPPKVVFASKATDIDPADTSPNTDIYRYSGNARMMSVARGGGVSNGVCANKAAISRNGRFVVFSSTASDLDAGMDEPANTTPDVFLRDVQTGTTSYISLSSTNSTSSDATGASLAAGEAFAGEAANQFLNRSISDDGRYVAFITNERLSVRDNAGTLDVYVRDRIAGVSVLASLSRGLGSGQGGSRANAGEIALAAGGRKVSFSTFATNLAHGDTTTTQNKKAYQSDISLLAQRSISDRDGDHKSDFSVFRPAAGLWFTLSAAVEGSVESIFFGENGNRIAPGDYDGDGKTDLAVFAPAAGRWEILQTSDSALVTRFFGTANDILTPADFDGDGRTDLAYFRPATGAWSILQSNSGSLRSVKFGINGDIPVMADHDGDNRADIAVFRPSTGDWWVLRSSDGTYQGTHWGENGDKPVVGDMDGDGKTDLAIFRGGTWYILNSRTGDFRAEQWGLATDRPVVSDYDGDGRTDIAVFRPSDGYWYVKQSSDDSLVSVKWGAGGDLPVPAAYVP